MDKIKPDTDAARINRLVNDPSIFHLLCGPGETEFDLSAFVEAPPHVIITCDKAGMIFVCLQPGIYELHSAFLPDMPRDEARAWGQAVFDWMFMHDAIEIITKCPLNNPATKGAAIAMGFSREWETIQTWTINGVPAKIDVYSLPIERWAKRATHMQAIGHDFHESLHAQYKAKGMDIATHDEDPLHDQYAGICVKMMEAAPFKAADFYNRWACMNGYAKIFIEELNPLIINITESRLRINSDSFEVL